MNPSPSMIARPIKDNAPFFTKTCNITPDFKRVSGFFPAVVRFPLKQSIAINCSGADVPLATEPAQSSSSSPSPSSSSPVFNASKIVKLEALEENIDKVIYRCRILVILGVSGSLVGSFLCFMKGCTHVVSSFMEYFVNRGKVILLLVEAIDVYLLGTVMLVFGMGLYEHFISNLDMAKLVSVEQPPQRSSLFGLLTLKERPQWLEV